MDREHILGIFNLWDSSGDGWIQQDELEAVMVKLGISEDDARIMFEQADTNQDGRVDYEEFLAWLFIDGEGSGKEKIQEITHTDVQHRGKKGEGIISAKAAVKDLSPQDITGLTNQAVPPGGCFDVLAATLWLLGDFPDLTPPPSKKKKPPKVNVEAVVWGKARKVMGRADFRRRLQRVDDLKVFAAEASKEKSDVLVKVQEYAAKETFQPEKIAMKSRSEAAKCLCGWVLGLKQALEAE